MRKAIQILIQVKNTLCEKVYVSIYLFIYLLEGGVLCRIILFPTVREAGGYKRSSVCCEEGGEKGKRKRAFLLRNINAAPKTKGWRTCRRLAVTRADELGSCRAVLCFAVPCLRIENLIKIERTLQAGQTLLDACLSPVFAAALQEEEE